MTEYKRYACPQGHSLGPVAMLGICQNVLCRACIESNFQIGGVSIREYPIEDLIVVDESPAATFAGAPTAHRTRVEHRGESVLFKHGELSKSIIFPKGVSDEQQ